MVGTETDFRSTISENQEPRQVLKLPDFAKKGIEMATEIKRTVAEELAFEYAGRLGKANADCMIARAKVNSLLSIIERDGTEYLSDAVILEVLKETRELLDSAQNR